MACAFEKFAKILILFVPASHIHMSEKSLHSFFAGLRRRLELDCDDVDSPSDEIESRNQTEKNSIEEDRKRTLQNPFLKDFFTGLQKKHKSKKLWFNKQNT